LALFALAIQIVLSFGHIHTDEFGLASAKSAPTALADSSSATFLSTHDPIHKSNGSADLDCPICASIQLAATSAPSAAPTLPLPARIGMFRLEAPAALALASSPHSLFRARAPPSV
jgi:hypothetical protein